MIIKFIIEAILKKMAAILNMKISNLDFSTPKTLEMCYYTTIYDDRIVFCAIFYFTVILAAILEAILVTLLNISGHFEKMLIILKI